jgi:hypothetical protein
VSAPPVPLPTRLAPTNPGAMTPCTDTKAAIARPCPFTDRWANFVGTSLRPLPGQRTPRGWQPPAAAKVLVTALDTLHKGSAQGRRGSLALVRTMTEKGNESG